MVWNLSCPAVSQICNFIFFPWSSTVLILKSIPIVEINVVLKVSSENLNIFSLNPKNIKNEHSKIQIPHLPEQHTSFADSWITNKQKFKQKIFTVILINSKLGIFRWNNWKIQSGTSPFIEFNWENFHSTDFSMIVSLSVTLFSHIIQFLRFSSL